MRNTGMHLSNVYSIPTRPSLSNHPHEESRHTTVPVFLHRLLHPTWTGMMTQTLHSLRLHHTAPPPPRQSQQSQPPAQSSTTPPVFDPKQWLNDPVLASKVGQSMLFALKLLGLGLGTSEIEVKVCYRQLAREYHPDKNNQDGTGLTVAEALDFLKLLNIANMFSEGKCDGSRKPMNLVPTGEISFLLLSRISCFLSTHVSFWYLFYTGPGSTENIFFSHRLCV